MSRALRGLARERFARGDATVVLEIVATRGSVPREAGTRMLVWSGGLAGTIGGGNLEWRAIATARAMLSDALRRPDDETFALGASLGQCCGGAVTLRYRMLDAASLAAWSASAPVPTIDVYGAGHVGRSLVRLLESLDVDVRWIDERDDAFPAEPSASNIGRVCVEPVDAEVRAAPPGTFHLVVTHQHDLDLRIVEAILRRGDFAFLGLIGSTTKRRRFEHLLLRRGIDPGLLPRMTCPIGLPTIASKEPAHIAISVVAELLPRLESWVSSPAVAAATAKAIADR